jgi:hypothetical protein
MTVLLCCYENVGYLATINSNRKYFFFLPGLYGITACLISYTESNLNVYQNDLTQQQLIHNYEVTNMSGLCWYVALCIDQKAK